MHVICILIYFIKCSSISVLLSYTTHMLILFLSISHNVESLSVHIVLLLLDNGQALICMYTCEYIHGYATRILIFPLVALFGWLFRLREMPHILSFSNHRIGLSSLPSFVISSYIHSHLLLIFHHHLPPYFFCFYNIFTYCTHIHYVHTKYLHLFLYVIIYLGRNCPDFLFHTNNFSSSMSIHTESNGIAEL